MAKLRYSCASDTGKTHEANEDRWLIDADFGLFLVADGMANDTAPEVVIQHLPELLHEHLTSATKLDDPLCHAHIQSALTELNGRVRQAMHSQGMIGLGTTLVAVIIRNCQSLVIHVGDSRAYLHRNGLLGQMTTDHSLVEELLTQGIISAAEARKARGNGGPTRFLGMSNDVEAAFQNLDLLIGDQLLLCSDGLPEMLDHECISQFVMDFNNPPSVCQALVDAANHAGGHDNVTVMSIMVDEC